MKKIKKFMLGMIAVLIFVLLVPVTVVLTGFCTAPQFFDTYYGELGDMYDKLRTTKGKKIVIIGTSSVAFGVDSALIEEELRSAGEEYTVCNFGLYGAIGTKAMLDLSEKFVGKGDIVVFAPEFYSQTLSLYYSAKEMWRAADGNYSILGGIARENIAEMVGGFVSFTAEKVKYSAQGGVKTDGVYTRASFDGNCDMKNADRSGNVMSNGFNPDQPIALDCGIFSSEFINYINSYSATVCSRGAKTLFSFPPMNRLAVTDYSENTLNEFYGFIADNFDYKVISNAEKYIMDAEWFYDTNYHLNSAGMTMRSINLLEDLKNELGIFTHTKAEMPEKPPLKTYENSDGLQGDNSDAALFVYADDANGGFIIVSLTGEGKSAEKLTVPYSYEGKKITGIASDAFKDNVTVRELIVQTNITYLRDGSFSGCSKLEKIILRHSAPSQIGVSYGLLADTEAVICVPKSAFSAFNTDYTWGWYAERLVSYEI